MTYTATLTGAAAVFNGSAASDTIIFTRVGANLAHNRFTAGDAGFVSNVDFNSALAGEQVLPADAASSVTVNTGAGVDVVQIGSAPSFASELLATFAVNNQGTDGDLDTLTIDDSASNTGNTINISSGAITGTGIVVTRSGFSFAGGLFVNAGSQGSLINVQSTFANEPLKILGGAGNDAVNIGSGGTIDNVGGSVIITGGNGFNSVSIDDSADSSLNTYFLSVGAFRRNETLTVQFADAQQSLTLTGGAANNIYEINFVFSTQIIAGAGDDQFVFSAGVPFSSTLNGGGGVDTLNFQQDFNDLRANLSSETVVGIDPQKVGNSTTILNFENFAGGSGNDIIIGSNSANVLAGGLGEDQIFGLDGNDTLDGGPGADVLVGGRGADVIFGAAVVPPLALLGGSSDFKPLALPDDDTIVWNNGDGSDVIDGAAGNDRVEVNGSTGATGDQFTISNSGVNMVALVSNNLLRFNSILPGSFDSTPITGLLVGEVVVGIDVRPANGRLYGLTNQSRIYTIAPETGGAVLVSTLSVPLNGTTFGVDFNPVPDRMRIVSDTDQNLRVDVDTGAVIVDGTIAYASGDPSFNVNPTIGGVAYINSVAGATSTTLYDIDVALDKLNIQSPPNSGALVTVGPLNVNFDTVGGFDIQPGTNTAFAVSQVNGNSNLYRIDLATGSATFLATVVSGPVSGFAILPTAGNALRFDRTNLGLFNLQMVNTETLDVRGDAGDDSFLAADVSMTTVSQIRFDGGLGSDTLNMPNRAVVDTANFIPAGVDVTGGSYAVTALNTETTYVFGGAGDSARFNDSPGNDVFYGLPSYSLLLDPTGAFGEAIGFQTVTAFRAGGTDISALYDSPSVDSFVGTPETAVLNGPGYSIQTVGFTVNAVLSSAGGKDNASFFDSEGNDTFIGSPSISYMVTGGVTNLVAGFATRGAQSSAGDDVAVLFDSTGADIFVSAMVTTPNSTPGGLPIELGSNSYMITGGVTNSAYKFKTVVANSFAGGTDFAYLYDSQGNDVLLAAGFEVDLLIQNSFIQVNRFGYVSASSLSARTDADGKPTNRTDVDSKRIAAIDFALVTPGPWFDV